MPACCVIVSKPFPSSTDSVFAQTLVALQTQDNPLHLLVSGGSTELNEALSAFEHLLPPKASIHSMDAFPPEDGLPLLPPNTPLREGRSVLQALISYQARLAIFFNCDWLSLPSLDTQRAGLGLLDCHLLLAPSPSLPERRMSEGSFPFAGRDDLCAEAMEQAARQLADPMPDASKLLQLLEQPTTTTAPEPAKKLSVCIPFCDRAELLEKTLRCLQNQTLPPAEIIIVDDGSTTPEAAALLQELAQSPGVHVLHQLRQGPAAARNAAAHAARGETLVFCDSDNLPRPEMLEVLEKALRCSGAFAITCGFHAFKESSDGNVAREYSYLPCSSAKELALLENCLGDANLALRREDFLQRGGFPGANHAASEDWQFLLQASMDGLDILSLPTILFDYRLSEGSHSHRRSELESARAALTGILQGTPAPWAKLWEHAAGLLRRPGIQQERASLEQLRAQLSKELSELTRGCNALRLQRQEAEFKLQEADSKLQDAECRLQDTEFKLQEADCKRQDAECRLQDAEFRLQEADCKLQRTRSALDEAISEKEALKEHVDAVARRQDALQEEVASLEASREALRSRLAETEASRSALQQQSDVVTEHLQLARQNMESLRQQYSTLLEQATDESRTLNETIASLNHETAVRQARLSLAEQAGEKMAEELTSQRAAFDSLQQHLRAREEAWEAELRRLEKQRSENATEINRLKSDLDRSRDKVARMQASFSWTCTMPLRALRRLLVDRFRAKSVAPQDTPPEPTKPAFSELTAADRTIPHSTFRYNVDTPRSWLPSPLPVLVRGWCFSCEGHHFQALRIRIGDRLYKGEYGLSRPDLLLAFPDQPQAGTGGFSAEIEVLPGDEKARFEVLRDDGEWICFLERPAGKDDPDAPGSYPHWLKTHEHLTQEALAALRKEAVSWSWQPKVSVLVPVYNTPAKWLLKAVESVRQQSYSRWELCLANDASTAPHIRPLLDELASADSRIKVCHLEVNGHICRASNAALDLATGELCILLDHDDELAPHALHFMVESFTKHPEAELIYSDEDKIDEQGQRFDPHFKPDWNPDLLTSQNYICHLAGMRTATLRSLGGLRPGLEGSQDWDLFLRLTEGRRAEAVQHIPRILYHWRAITGSTALHTGEKDYISRSAQRALEDHFKRLGLTATLSRTPGGHWHVRHQLPDPAPLVSIIIPTKNAGGLVAQCVVSLYAKTNYKPFEVLLVDNRSDDPASLETFAALARDYGVRVVPYDKPFNYSAINNFAVTQARGEVVCLLNNDIEVLSPDWLGDMVAQALRPEIGAVGARLYYPDDRLQHAGVITGLGGVAGHAFKHLRRHEPGVQFRPHLVQNLSAVTAACLAVRKSVFEEVGGLDAARLTVAFNDVDFCLRIQAKGYRNLYTPAAELYHHESASRGAEDSPEKIRRFQSEIAVMKERWGDSLLNDPAYNPNYSLDSEDFALAYPPRLP